MTTQLPRVLRKNLTDAERRLWHHLRDRQLGGWKFRRQHPVGPFIVDFICLEKKVVIEGDGGQHAENEEEDTQRSAYLEKMGYQILRFWNNEVLQETEAVLTTIFESLADAPPLTPALSPRRGERGLMADFLGDYWQDQSV